MEVLLDVGTLRLMLYAGALLLAVGVMVYLRDTLRVQLQRPLVQAALLASATLAALAVGVTLVYRARERFEPKLVGRAFLLLGSLLVPLNPWFLERSGFIEDRGNAWAVALVCFALYTAIAVGLGERVFVFMSYAAAVLTAWLLTFRVTGGAAPGTYALAILAVSLAFMHAEALVERTGRGRTWERFGDPLRICAHLGIAATLVLYTVVARLAPAELFAGFRHFGGGGYTPWVGVAVAIVAAYAYFYAAWRRRSPQITYVGVASALWAVALWLLAADAPPGAWLTACGAAALGLGLLGRALAGREVWGGPLRATARALAWVGFAASALPAAALATGFVDVRWFTTAGALLVLAAFALDAADGDRPWAAFPMPALALLAVMHLLDAGGVERVYAHAVLALAAALGPPLASLLAGARPGLTRGLALGSAAVTCTLAPVALVWSAIEADRMPEQGPYRAIPVVLAVGAAFAVHGWYATVVPYWRYALYAFALIFGQLATILAAAAIQVGAGIEARNNVLTLLTFPYACLAGWLVLRRAADERVAEVAVALRCGTWLGTLTGALFGLAAVRDALAAGGGSVRWAVAYAALAAAPLVAAFAAGAGAAATAECLAGTVLALASYAGVVHGAADLAGANGAAVWYVGLGLAPFGLALARRGAGGPGRDVSAPIGWAADAVAAQLAVVAGLALVAAADTGVVGASHAPGTPGRLGHVLMSALVCAYGLRRAAAGSAMVSAWVAHSTAAGLIFLLSLADNFDVSWSARALALPVLGAAAAAAARRLPAGLGWLAAPLAVTAHASFWLAFVAACALAAPEVGLSNPGLTKPVATFAVLAGCGWVLARTAGDATATVYAPLWRALALATYALLGLRLGFHPWRESSFYTLPSGAALVALGVLAARRDRDDAAPMLWLGSIVAAAPLLLHALEYRFVRGVSPLGYDLATITVALGLAAIGVLLQLKAPSTVGALALGADLVVVVFSQIRWAEIPIAVYSAAVGASLFGAAWLLLYRREQLVRLRDRMRERREAFQEWR
jgi:hypothetical protein